MSNASVNRFGANNAASDKTALFLKVFSGEVITAFEKATVMLDKHTVRTIKSGKSAQFPVLGRMPSAEYHTPGAEILGQAIQSSERNITIEKLLISHVFLADIDEAMSHFDVRSKYSKMMSHELALTFDNHVMRQIILAAQASATVTDSLNDGGLVHTDSDLASATDADKFTAWKSLFTAVAANFDNKHIKGTRYLAMKPDDFYFLIEYADSNGLSFIHKDIDGSGSFAEGTLPKAMGINIISTPLLPTTDYSGQTYNAVNASNTEAIAWTEDAVGTVKLMDLSLQSEWDIRRQGELLVARYAMGHGILQPECAVHARTAAP